MKFKVKITKGLIDESVCGLATGCVLARAMRPMFAMPVLVQRQVGVKEVYVKKFVDFFTNDLNAAPVFVKLGKDAYHFTEDFDRDRSSVSPCELEFELTEDGLKNLAFDVQDLLDAVSVMEYIEVF